jgi:hypothetical protein
MTKRNWEDRFSRARAQSSKKKRRSRGRERRKGRCKTGVKRCQFGGREDGGEAGEGGLAEAGGDENVGLGCESWIEPEELEADPLEPDIPEPGIPSPSPLQPTSRGCGRRGVPETICARAGTADSGLWRKFDGSQPYQPQRLS